MKTLMQWEWQKLYIPPSVAKKRNNIVKVLNVIPSEPEKFPPIESLREHDTVFITGDGKCLAQDVEEFTSWGIGHDIYAVNRSLIFHERQVLHWAAVDVEEATWFTQYVNGNVEPRRRIIRHSIGGETHFGNTDGVGLYDIYWTMDYQWENEYQRRVFVGNTGYFSVLTALKMGYSKVVLGGMPLNQDPHWYDPDDADGPNWTGLTYCQWMDFKMKHSGADRVRSLQGYSSFILGQATKDWVLNGAIRNN